MYQTNWDNHRKTVETINENDINEVLNQLANHELPPLQQFLQIIQKASQLLQQRVSYIELNITEASQITIIGDTHGCFQSIITLFDALKKDSCGLPNVNNYFIFNGDYCDRGDFVYINRGNHESANISLSSDGLEYNLYKEMMQKYKSEKQFLKPAIEAVKNLFCYMSIAININRRILITHGGTPKDRSLQLSAIFTQKVDFNTPITSSESKSHWQQMLWNYSRKEEDYQFLRVNDLKLMIVGHSASPYHNIHIFSDSGKLCNLVVNEQQFQKLTKFYSSQRSIIEVFSSPTNKGDYFALQLRLCDVDDFEAWNFIFLGNANKILQK